MAFGDPPLSWQQGNVWISNASDYSVTIPYATSAGATTVPLVFVPEGAPLEEDDSPFAWLRGQVAEMTDLARAA